MIRDGLNNAGFSIGDQAVTQGESRLGVNAQPHLIQYDITQSPVFPMQIKASTAPAETKNNVRLMMMGVG